MKDPVIIDNVLNIDDYNKLISLVDNPKSFEYQKGFSRYVVSDFQMPFLKELAEKLVPLAKQVFNSNYLLPTYALFSHYEGLDPQPSLYKHKDDNACTYTLDLCVYQNDPWDLWVENKNYILFKNQALAYYGNDQWHWREDFPQPK